MKTFEPTFESLYQYSAPEWFRNAKFGIWCHWGPQSVPMFGDWYARNMYIQGTQQYEYHVRHYGHPSRFGYKDICALWHAEKFDPHALMERFVRSGARYFVTQAVHHDHFFNYDSQVNPMNSMKVGPHRDIVSEWQAEARLHGLPFGVTEHLAASFSWWRVNKGCDQTGPYAGVPYDGNDPAWRDFYHDNYEHGTDHPQLARPWHTANPRFQAYWLRAVTEMIDRFHPDLLYSDGALPFGECWEDVVKPMVPQEYVQGLKAVAHLYNTSIADHGENHSVYLQKDNRPEIWKVGTLDVEKSQLPGVFEEPWHTDTCIGNWFYDVHSPYKSPEQIVEMLVDIISKNGVMLLNVLQKPDGTLDEEALWILDQLEKWFAVAGEAVYDTRPWRVFSEGETRVRLEGFSEFKTSWGEHDYRFTTRDGKVYAFMMGARAGVPAVLYSFKDQQVRSVELLGCGPVPFQQAFGVLTVQLPDQLPLFAANALRITFE